MQEEFSYKEEKMLVIAINYGGKDEILRAVNTRICKKDRSDTLDEETLSENMDL